MSEDGPTTEQTKVDEFKPAGSACTSHPLLRRRLSSFYHTVVALCLGWTMVTAGSLAWNIHIQRLQSGELAAREARANFNKDQAFRFWGTRHGGVYVPINDRTPPNPNLADLPERDITTPSGIRLTLMNPAYMVRQMMDEFGELYGIRGRITSLHPLNPNNAPDEWERAGLVAFEQGVTEVTGTTNIGNTPHFRLMRPMTTEHSCLKCHASQGYKEGDIRGGVGVAVSLEPYNQMAERNITTLSASHFGIWLCGMSAIGIGISRHRRRILSDTADEIAFHQLSDKNELILASVAEGIYGIDGNGLLTFINPAGAHMLGYQPEELLGQPIHTRIHSRHPDGSLYPANECPLQTTLHDGVPCASGDDVFWRRDGSSFPVEFLGAPMNGTIGTGAVVVFRDVTEARKKEAELAKRAEELQASNAELEQFAYVASHDLREPLRMVSSYMTLLERRYGDKLDADGREFIGFATDGALRMDRLVLSLLEYSRVGRIAAPMKPAPMGELLAQAITNLGVSIRELGAEIVTAPDLPTICVCADEVIRLFQNLIGNSLKFHSPDRKPVIQILCERQGGNWLFHVTDNGIGIAPEYFERIFQIFQRLHTRDAYEGTGIGLAICRKIVQRHGGRIWVESEPDQGSTFSFTLPDTVSDISR